MNGEHQSHADFKQRIIANTVDTERHWRNPRVDISKVDSLRSGVS